MKGKELANPRLTKKESTMGRGSLDMLDEVEEENEETILCIFIINRIWSHEY